MGYAVLHMEKTSGTDSGMSAHIERTIHPKNADESRTHLNRELIQFPDGVKNRTEAIQHRLDTAGLNRKIGKNQVRAIRVLLTGSPQDMKRIEQNGRLDEWCDDNLKWLYKTYGKENIVSAVLHMDETTPHIHATMIPIVKGERRKAKAEQEQTAGKKKYRKKNPENTRLCADDVMSRVKLKEYQNSYAESMQSYGLERGIEGSEARHVSTSQYYRDLMDQSKHVKEDLATLQQNKEQAEKELSSIKGKIKTQNLKGTFINVANSAAKGLGSILGSPTIENQRQEIESLTSENKDLKDKIKTLNQTILTNEAKHKEETTKLNSKLDRIFNLFPVVKELLFIEELARIIGFGKEMIRDLLDMKPVFFSGKLYSPEHKLNFETKHSQAQVESDPKEKGKLRLAIDGRDAYDWFRQKRRELSQALGIKPKQTPAVEQGKRKGMKM